MFPHFLKEKIERIRLALKAKADKRAEMKEVDTEYSKRYKVEHPIDPTDKVLRESGGQDITAI